MPTFFINAIGALSDNRLAAFVRSSTPLGYPVQYQMMDRSPESKGAAASHRHMHEPRNTLLPQTRCKSHCLMASASWNHSYTSRIPSGKGILGSHPRRLIFAMSSNLRGVPSGFELSH